MRKGLFGWGPRDVEADRERPGQIVAGDQDALAWDDVGGHLLRLRRPQQSVCATLGRLIPPKKIPRRPDRYRTLDELDFVTNPVDW